MMNARLVGKKEIIQPISNRIVEEGGHSEESLRYQIHPLHQYLES